ncbi:DNA/RNA non-specific endonuclease [Neisseria macacae ATCC 33926]|uniref:DNA/RNA non-specific endonuclease n=1 Tax=Neisseria macacae ATCC 33926 TaxID=997348 RepID=A0AA36XKT9_9NEIS|nr:DNA/RNA non-specific endonuclease [Neisseria macacae ATCC 33926]
MNGRSTGLSAPNKSVYSQRSSEKFQTTFLQTNHTPGTPGLKQMPNHTVIV